MTEELRAAAHIHVINDDEDILDLYRTLLEDAGYEVTTSKFAFEHPSDVERLAPDLVILDIKFGAQPLGWRMLQKLRMYTPTARLPLVVATAAINEAREQEEYLLSRGIGVVYKPFDIDDFLEDVRLALHTRRGLVEAVHAVSEEGERQRA